MKRNASGRLKPLQNLSGTRADEAAVRFAQSRRDLASREARLNQLQTYVGEYARPETRAVSAAMLSNRSAFMGQLHRAVQVQQDNVTRALEQCGVEQARLLLARRDSAVLERLAACYRGREARQAERVAQHEMDEVAARLCRDATTAAQGPRDE